MLAEQATYEDAFCDFWIERRVGFIGSDLGRLGPFLVLACSIAGACIWNVSRG